MLPEAILRFRQGVGRLIRAPPTGAVLVADPRLLRAGYGARLRPPRSLAPRRGPHARGGASLIATSSKRRPSVSSVTTQPVPIGGRALTFEDARALGGAAPARLDAGASKRHGALSRADRVVAPAGEAVYGVNTGFGALKSGPHRRPRTAALQVNLLRSHAAGAGPELEPAVVGSCSALRAHSLSLGRERSAPGARARLLALASANPSGRPEQGISRPSGDLIPLAISASSVSARRGEARGSRGAGRGASREAGRRRFRARGRRRARPHQRHAGGPLRSGCSRCRRLRSAPAAHAALRALGGRRCGGARAVRSARPR